MTVNEFLVRHVDEQILGDLEAMATLAATGKQGELGYPIVMTVFSGCELLGRMMVPGNTRAAFVAYWVEHLYPGTDRAGAEALYRLVRSGTGPGFVAMPGIRVTTSRSHDHLSMADGAFVIDALTLHDDFRASYTRARGDLVAQGEPGLLDLLSWLEGEHAELIRRLPVREPAEASSEAGPASAADDTMRAAATADVVAAPVSDDGHLRVARALAGPPV
jgi:hypothetical protein